MEFIGMHHNQQYDPSRSSKFARGIRLIIDALKGKQYDYTTGSLKSSIVLLAIPMVLEMSMESIFAIVDIFFVSRLGPDAITVVGLTEAVITLVYAVAVGFSMAVTAVIARRIGENQPGLAAISSGQALIICGLIYCVIGSIGSLFSGEILALMGASDSVIKLGTGYTTTMLGGSISILLLFVVSAIFRGAGDPMIAMKALLIANGINCILDPCLIFGWGPFPELGVTGAAIASNIGRGVGSAYLIYRLFYCGARFRLSMHHLKPNLSIIKNLLSVSAGGIMQFFIATASWVFLVRIVALFGTQAVAGYTISIRIAMLTFLPAWGLSTAAATLVGQNLGAGKPQRAEEAVWQTTRYGLIFMSIVAVILLISAKELSMLFTADEQVIAVSTMCLQVIAIGYPFFAIGMVLTQAFNGSGDTMTPTKINFVGFWLVQIPFAWVCATQLNWQTFGVISSVVLADALIAFFAWYYFRQGAWKNKVI